MDLGLQSPASFCKGHFSAGIARYRSLCCICIRYFMERGVCSFSANDRESDTPRVSDAESGNLTLASEVRWRRGDGIASAGLYFSCP